MQVKVGNVIIGRGKNNNRIPIQSMIKNSIIDIDLTLNKINKLAQIGCDIIRVTIPDNDTVKALKTIVKESPIPIVSDIHFDYRLAIKSIEAGTHKVRINPGNIGDESKVKEVIKCLQEYKIPVRIGINAGSLPIDLKKTSMQNVDIMLESAKREVNYFEKYGYDNIVLSFKSSDVLETIKVNRLAKKQFEFPLHIGVTEAGDFIDGTIKNSTGLAILLHEGIGDTIRVSLTSKEEDEIIVGQKILQSLNLLERKFEIISCPTCGRTEVDIEKIVKKVKETLKTIDLKKKLKIAIMGCIVNGPGEAEHADFGVACGKRESIIFKNGKKLKIINNEAIYDELLIMVKQYENS